uniref:Galactose-3-O-sulfotransferase 2-like n=1 Tax=Scleropages formosus TaxID=113540 RepID=A0A8C9VJP8_SCLFO
ILTLLFSELFQIATASCRPHKHIMFLKTHKTGSSTVLNMLYRFGDERGLWFALPTSDHFGYPNYFSAHHVRGYQSDSQQHFDILANHMRFQKSEVEKVMPPDTFYFSIMGDPVTMAKSAFSYFKTISPAFSQAESFHAFVSKPWKYYNPYVQYSHFSRNMMWFDFGFDHNANYSESLAMKGESVIRKTFNMILLLEYFDESLVLLRHALCWPMEAIITFSMNMQQSGSNEEMLLTENQERRLRDWNALDWHLYKAFNHTFWEEVERFGVARMEQELVILRNLRAKQMQTCLLEDGKLVESNKISDADLKPFQTGVKKILGYQLKPDLDNATHKACLNMVRPEIPYRKLLEAKQSLSAPPSLEKNSKM